MSHAPEAQKRPQLPEFLPTGTITFLFTDIEGSTQRWEHYRAAMEAAVVRQEQLLTAAIQEHGGYVFKKVGDAFCAAFASAPDALLAAVDAQRALAGDDFSAVDGLRVRMGLHTGRAEERDADYFGPAINRVARLMSIGHGGQILLSGITRELVHNDLPQASTLVELGSHRLKDLIEPEQVWQLTVEGLPSTFPPLKSLNALPNNLPMQRTTFVGRGTTVAEIKKLFDRHRLVTLVGPGGVGKTRIAIQVGADLLKQYVDGVWFADFSPISDPQLVASVIAHVLGMPQQQGHRTDELIPIWLRRKKLLLILDNCEHVLEIVAAIVANIIGTAPDVRVLNTSRQVLDISGEDVFRVPSLDVPPKGAGFSTEALSKFGAVALFVDRAKSVDKSFALTADNAPNVADICWRLDGLPLAIELAAARVKVLSVLNLSQRLNERFKILTGGSRDVLPRQKTLSALIDWSYDLLTPQEQMLFQRLGIFAGGFGLEAATKVCGGVGLDVDILDLLTSLTDKSLVIADTSGQQERYRLLESTRVYALEKLKPGERDLLADRHAKHYAEMAQVDDRRYGTGSALVWIAGVQLELDNYRAALEWSLTRGNDVVAGGIIAGSLSAFWREQDLTVEWRYWVDAALERVSATEHPHIVARLLRAKAAFLYGSRTCEVAAQAIDMYEAAGDRHGAAYARNILAQGLYQSGKLHEGMKVILQSLAVMRECHDQFGTANGLDMQANIARGLGAFSEARDLHAQALAIYKSLGSELDVALSLTNIAELEFTEGHPDAALRAVREAIAIDHRRGVDSVNLMIGHLNSVIYRIALKDLDGAREPAREGLQIARQMQAAPYIGIAMQHLALLMALQGEPHGAARVLGYVDTQFKALGIEREYTERWGFDKLMRTIREHLNETEITKLAAEGALWSEDQAVEVALNI